MRCTQRTFPHPRTINVSCKSGAINSESHIYWQILSPLWQTCSTDQHQRRFLWASNQALHFLSTQDLQALLGLNNTSNAIDMSRRTNIIYFYTYIIIYSLTSPTAVFTICAVQHNLRKFSENV